MKGNGKVNAYRPVRSPRSIKHHSSQRSIPVRILQRDRVRASRTHLDLLLDIQYGLSIQSRLEQIVRLIRILLSSDQHLGLGVVEDVLEFADRESRRKRESNRIASKD
jgi:hypothetical protein